MLLFLKKSQLCCRNSSFRLPQIPQFECRFSSLCIAGTRGALIGLMAVFSKTFINGICGALTGIMAYVVYKITSHQKIIAKDVVAAGVLGFVAGGVIGLAGKITVKTFICTVLGGGAAGLAKRLWF